MKEARAARAKRTEKMMAREEVSGEVRWDEIGEEAEETALRAERRIKTGTTTPMIMARRAV